jgi:hypothetical protein
LKAGATASLILACVLLTAAGLLAGEVSRLTLPNGLRVVVVHSSLAPVVSTVMNYRVGSNEAPAGFPVTAARTAMRWPANKKTRGMCWGLESIPKL